MTLDQLLQSLLETLHEENLDTYIELIREGHHIPFGAVNRPDHEYWTSDPCFLLYDTLLKCLNGMVDLETLLNE